MLLILFGQNSFLRNFWLSYITWHIDYFWRLFYKVLQTNPRSFERLLWWPRSKEILRNLTQQRQFCYIKRYLGMDNYSMIFENSSNIKICVALIFAFLCLQVQCFLCQLWSKLVITHGLEVTKFAQLIKILEKFWDNQWFYRWRHLSTFSPVEQINFVSANITLISCILFVVCNSAFSSDWMPKF